MTLVQRFGSAAGNLNIHFHSLVIDGVYCLRGGKATFQYVAAPTTEEMARLVERIAMRVMRLLTRRGYLIEEDGVAVLEKGEGDETLEPLQAAACSYRIALGPRRGKKVWSLKMTEAQPSKNRGQGIGVRIGVRIGVKYHFIVLLCYTLDDRRWLELLNKLSAFMILDPHFL